MSGLEGLALAASIGAVLEMADRAYKVVFKYLPAVKTARKDAERLINEVRTLCGVLHSLKIFAAALEGEDPGATEKAFRMQHIESCYHVLSKIRSDLEKAEAEFDSKNKLKALHRRLRWPFCEEETNRLLERVSAHKQTMNLAMTADSVTVLLRKLSRYHGDTGRRIEEMQSDVRRALEITRRVDINAKRRQVLDFFSRADTQAAFEASVAKRFPFTGLWLTEGDEFRGWLSAPRSRLWLGGIPGAGKTVLAGAMIEEALSFSNPSCAVAFFFCDSSNDTVVSPSDLLGALAGQLARQGDDAFEVLEEYFAELNPDHGLPRAATEKRLAQVLLEMLNTFLRVYIVIDGLDEYGDAATDMVEVLTGLWDSAESCSLAFLSRDEPHIRNYLEDDFAYVKVEARKEDIEPYVLAKIEEWVSQKFKKTKRRISDGTKEAIIRTLVDESDGMFRWVTCQIDYICGEFSTDKERLDALKGLPPTLGKTYERILDRINQRGVHIQKLAQRVLLLIAGNRARITIPELQEAVSTYIARPDDLVTEEEIALRCSSLIRKSNDGERFEFAHFTVREFLESEDLLGTAYEEYHLSPRTVAVMAASTSIRFLLRTEFSEETRDYHVTAKDALERLDLHPFYSFASKYWVSNSLGFDNDEVRRLTLDLFRQPKVGNFTNWAIELCRHFFSRPVDWGSRAKPTYNQTDMVAFKNLVNRILRADFTPLHLASVLAIPWLCERLLLGGAGVNATSLAGTPLHCAIMGPLVFFDADPRLSEDTDRMYHLRLFGGSDRLSTLQVLLKAGARSGEMCHTFRFSFSPIYFSFHIGLQTTDFTLFLELLRVGTPVNPDTCRFILGAYKSLLARMPDRVDGIKGYEAFSGALEGILKYTADASEDNDQSRAQELRAGTLQFVSTVKTQFSWGASIEFNLGSTSGSGEQRLQETKLAVKFGDAGAVRRLLEGAGHDLVHHKLEGGRTLLHFSTIHVSLEVLRVLLDAGSDIEATDDQGWTPLSCCIYDYQANLLRELLVRGAKLDVEVKSGWTLWHHAARLNSVEILGVLIQEVGDKIPEALARQTKSGHTPLSLAFSASDIQAIFVILSHAKGQLACFQSPDPLYRLAAQNTDSTHLLRTMVEAGVPLDEVDDGDTPLHYLDSGHGPDFALFLISYYPNAGPRAKDGRTPLELLLISLLAEDSFDSGWETLETLVEHDPVGVRKLWPVFCTIASSTQCTSRDAYCEACRSRFDRVFEFLLKHGALAAFEAEHGSSGIIPLLSSFLTNTKCKSLFGSKTVSETLRRTKHWESAKSDVLMIDFFAEAVGLGFESIVSLILQKGVDVHSPGRDVSALERACWPGSACTPSTFQNLIESAEPTKLDDSSRNQNGLVHVLGLKTVKDATEKLGILLAKGANPNAKTGKGVPALVSHLRQRSTETALILLDAGADPNLQDNYGWDSLLTAVLLNNIAFLEAVKHRSAGSINWQQKCTIMSESEVIHGCNALHIAALESAGQLECIQFYLEGGYLDSESVVTAEGYNYLHLAIKSNNMAALRALGSWQTEKTLNGRCWDPDRTPLELAIRKGSVAAVEILVDLGAKQIPDVNGVSPKLLALIQGKDEIADILDSSRGATPSGTDTKGKFLTTGLRTALEQAIERNKIGMCRTLLHLGCPFNQPLVKCGGCSPLVWALRGRKVDIVAWMLTTEVDLNITQPICRSCSGPDNYRKDPLEFMASSSILTEVLPDALTKYLRHGGLPFIDTDSPLHWATESANLEGIRAILQHIRDNLGLYRTRHSSILDGCTSTEDVIRVFVNTVTCKDHNATTPLHIAADRGKHDIIIELLQNGADLEAKDRYLRTPLHCAVRFAPGEVLEETLKILLDAGASLESRNENFRTPLLEAAFHSELKAAEILVANGADIHARDSGERSVLSLCDDPEIFSYFLQLGLDPLSLDQFGLCSLHHALSEPDVRPMILNNLDIRTIPPIPTGATEVEYDVVVPILRRLRLINKRRAHLGQSDPFVELQPSKHISPLCLATRYDEFEVIHVTLDAGAEIDFEGCEEGSALMAACSAGRFEAVKILVRRGASLAYISVRDSKVKSAITAARHFPKIIAWLLVGRHTELPRITQSNPTASDGVPLMSWSGLRHASIRLSQEDRKWLSEFEGDVSDWALRVTQLRSGYAGKVGYTVHPG